MIVLDPIKEDENYAHTMHVVYPRSVIISHGVYDNIVDMINLKTLISQNIDKTELTNVYGGKTPWNFFNENKEFLRFVDYLVSKHKNTNSFFNKSNWYDKQIGFETWGNEIKKGDEVRFHHHIHHHCILYLSDGDPLILPELKITIVPKIGSYYIFPPLIWHGVKKIEKDSGTRYCLVVNFIEKPDWKINKVIQDFKNDRK
jgi:hypothetical protein